MDARGQWKVKVKIYVGKNANVASYKTTVSGRYFTRSRYNPNITAKVKKLKNFFDYYLPVTVKLVDRYDEIENQKINSEEEKNFNTTTEKTIKEINGVFKQFLNILPDEEKDGFFICKLQKM